MGKSPAAIIIARYVCPVVSVCPVQTAHQAPDTARASMPPTKTGISPPRHPTILLSPMGAGCSLAPWERASSAYSVRRTILRSLLDRIAVPSTPLRTPAPGLRPSRPLGRSAESSSIHPRICAACRPPSPSVLESVSTNHPRSATPLAPRPVSMTMPTRLLHPRKAIGLSSV